MILVWILVDVLRHILWWIRLCAWLVHARLLCNELFDRIPLLLVAIPGDLARIAVVGGYAAWIRRRDGAGATELARIVCEERVVALRTFLERRLARIRLRGR